MYKKLRSLIIIVAIAIVGMNVNAKEKATREIELGVITGFKYPQCYNKTREKHLLKYLKTVAPDFKIISEDVDIFLGENSEKIKNYKRIYIPGYVYIFSQKMYDGMSSYISKGGLIITGNILGIIDSNEDYKYKYDEDEVVKNDNPITGLSGRAFIHLESIKFVGETPMTVDIAKDKDFPANGVADATHISSAVLVITGQGFYQKKTKRDAIVLSYKKNGKGACIYFPRVTSPEIAQVEKNIFSESVLNWLCEQD